MLQDLTGKEGVLRWNLLEHQQVCLRNFCLVRLRDSSKRLQVHEQFNFYMYCTVVQFSTYGHGIMNSESKMLTLR